MRKLFYAFLITGVLSMGSCTLPKMVKMSQQQQLTVTPNPLEVHKDTVAFQLSVNLPVKMLKKGTVYTVNTFYKYGDQEVALDPIPFRAEDYPAAATEQPRITKDMAFGYAPAMKSGILQVEGVASKAAKSKASPRLDVATGVITTSKLVKPVYFAAYAGHGYNNAEEIVPVVIPDFIFEQGRSVLRTSEIKSDKGKKLDGFIASKNITRTVTITGTHSPEGAERINSRLAPDRAAAIEKFYRQEMKKYDYKGMADSIKFIQKPIVRDWTQFKQALASYDKLSSEQKTEYLNIINGSGTFESQEAALHKLPTYKQVFKDVYPGLRTAKTEILTVKDKKSDAEISVLAKQIAQNQVKADTLSFEELMYSATLTPSIDEKITIYTAATKSGTHWNAHNNLGAAYIAKAIESPSMQADLATKAQAQLDLAAKLSQGPEVNANMATLSLMQGNPYKTVSYSGNALSAGLRGDNAAGLNGVKGAAEIMVAKYGDAVRSEAAANNTAVNTFNKGLAQLLNKDYSNALASFQAASKADTKMAIAFYGAAVASARMSNTDGVVSNITSAVQLDPSLKDKALNDLEFAKVNNLDAFRNALK